LPSGRYAARLAANGHACSFELAVPESKAPITELAPIVCEVKR
jgi:hypothetical protein